MTNVDPDVITPDEVGAPGVAVERAGPPRDPALVAAAESALAEPASMDHSEFWALAAQARILSMSGAAPKSVRRDPHLALHLALVGRDLGISASASLELIDIIETKRGSGDYRLSLSPQLMNGQLRRLGIGCILPAERTAWRCEAVAFGPEGPDRRCTRTGVVAHVGKCKCDVLGTSEFTWEDAQMAELAGAECEPGQHKEVTRQRANGQGSYRTCGCNQGYRTYPKRMLWWRASGFAADDFFPEAGLGLYSPEALGATTGADGRPIDVDSVELPPGYEPAAVGQGNGGGGQQAERQAEPEELWDLQEQIHSLPAGAKAELGEKWQGEDSRVRGHYAYRLPKRLLGTARAMVNAHWGRARAAGVDKDVELAALRDVLAHGVLSLFRCPWPTATAAEAPSPAPEPEPRPEVPAEPPQDESEPQGPADGGPEWDSLMRALADEVTVMARGVPADVGTRIVTEVEGLHWVALNKEIDLAGMAGDYPPESPVDYRRMALTAHRLEAFLSSGVVPAGEVAGDGADAE